MAKKSGKTERPKSEARGAGLSFSAAVDQTMADEKLAAIAVIDRLKDTLGCDSDTELAWVLSTSRQNIWKWRNRNSVPYREVVFISLWAGISLEYLLTGRGPRRFRIPPNDRGDYELLRGILALAVKPRGGPRHFTPALAKQLASAFERAEQTMARLVEDDGLSIDEARTVALAAIVPFR